MTLPNPVTFIGAPGSPYTRKMRALLRYRRIPYLQVQQMSREAAALPQPKVPLLPTFYLPDASGEIVPVTDSTPLIRRFEAEVEGRSVIPSDPVLAFLDELVEDYADEWLTKCMFHYRWYHEADASKAGAVLPHWIRVDVTDEQIAPMQKSFRERQVGRLGVVGSNAVTAPVIEESYRRFLRIFDAHLQTSRFLFGQRPAAADFALAGQLTCLAFFDPTPAAVTIEESVRVYAWTESIEELSGLVVEDADWIDRSEISASLRAMLAEIGRVHAPFLVANARALEREDEQLEAEIDGKRWIQKPFPYQAKCLRWLRASYDELAPGDRSQVDAILSGTGCEQLFA